MAAEVGSPAPEFSLPDQEKNVVALGDLRGSNALVVFIPFPFTGICTAEACTLEANLAKLSDFDAKVVIITTHAVPTNKHWASENAISIPVLSDFWPHGAIAQAYGSFNDALGAANRVTYVLDGDAVVRQVIATESLGIAREFEAYEQALAAL